MRLTVLGGSGAWPVPDQACSGFLVEHDGFRLLLDLGYAALPELLRHTGAGQIDAVLISHGHPDHCADLNPLLRARALTDDPPPALPVYALPGALDAVLALDRPGMLDAAYRRHDLHPGRPLEIGPFAVATRPLPHWVPNAGIRLSAGDRVLAYTGDSGPGPDVVDLARDADLLVAEATYVDTVPDHSRGHLTSAREAGEQATQAGVRRLLLTHLWPGTDPASALGSAGRRYQNEIGVASTGLVIDLDGGRRSGV